MQLDQFTMNTAELGFVVPRYVIGLYFRQDSGLNSHPRHDQFTTVIGVCVWTA